MSKKISRIIGICMLIVAVCFILYALNNPQASFNMPLYLTYILYGIYAIATIVLLIAPFKGKDEDEYYEKQGYKNENKTSK